MKYIRRTLEPVLLKAAKEFPVIMLTGPRQSGKTTCSVAPCSGRDNCLILNKILHNLCSKIGPY